MGWFGSSSKRLVILTLLGLAAAMLVWFPPGQYGFYPRCPVYEWTGLVCPGCGGTRALAALLRGHLGEALKWNGLVVGLLPVALGYGVVGMVRGRWAKVPHGVWAALGVVMGIFTAWRNIRG
jgi:hypothetical protein